jgi:hypothetical protein
MERQGLFGWEELDTHYGLIFPLAGSEQNKTENHQADDKENHRRIIAFFVITH